MRYIIEELDTMEGRMFEYAVADLMFHNGFRDVSVTQGSGDYGIDILARRKNVKYAIQCKRWKSSVGVKAVQEAGLGTDYYHCDAAAVITNSTFTSQAKNLANTTGVRLWGRDFLNELIENYDEGYDEDNPEESIVQQYDKYRQYVEEKSSKSFSEQSVANNEKIEVKTQRISLRKGWKIVAIILTIFYAMIFFDLLVAWDTSTFVFCAFFFGLPIFVCWMIATKD